jgi:hypothetical protein
MKSTPPEIKTVWHDVENGNAWESGEMSSKIKKLYFVMIAFHAANEELND